MLIKILIKLTYVTKPKTFLWCKYNVCDKYLGRSFFSLYSNEQFTELYSQYTKKFNLSVTEGRKHLRDQIKENSPR